MSKQDEKQLYDVERKKITQPVGRAVEVTMLRRARFFCTLRLGDNQINLHVRVVLRVSIPSRLVCARRYTHTLICLLDGSAQTRAHNIASG